MKHVRFPVFQVFGCRPGSSRPETCPAPHTRRRHGDAPNRLRSGPSAARSAALPDPFPSRAHSGPGDRSGSHAASATRLRFEFHDVYVTRTYYEKYFFNVPCSPHRYEFMNDHIRCHHVGRLTEWMTIMHLARRATQDDGSANVEPNNRHSRLHPALTIPGFPRSLRCRRGCCSHAGECMSALSYPRK